MFSPSVPVSVSEALALLPELFLLGVFFVIDFLTGDSSSIVSSAAASLLFLLTFRRGVSGTGGGSIENEFSSPPAVDP